MAEADVALVDGLLDEIDARLRRREGLRQGRERDRPALPPGRELLDLGLEPGLGEISGHGQDHVLRREVFGVEGLEVGRRDGLVGGLGRLPGHGVVAVEELLVLPAEDAVRLVVGLAQLLDEAGLGQLQGLLAESRIPEHVEERGQALVEVLGQDRQAEGRGPLPDHEVQGAAEEIDAVLDGRSFFGGRAALDELVAEDAAETGLVLGDVEVAAVDDGGDVEERQALVLLDVGPQAAGVNGPGRLGVRRLVLEGLVLELGGVLGLGQAQSGAEDREGQDGDDRLFHVVLLTGPTSGCRSPSGCCP